MKTTQTPLRIDIVSDVMCPWCIIGYRQLAIAIEERNVLHEIHWHPFELNPYMPPEGQDGRQHVMEKTRDFFPEILILTCGSDPVPPKEYDPEAYPLNR